MQRVDNLLGAPREMDADVPSQAYDDDSMESDPPRAHAPARPRISVGCSEQSDGERVQRHSHSRKCQERLLDAQSFHGGTPLKTRKTSTRPRISRTAGA